jgi:carbonic anhydrase
VIDVLDDILAHNARFVAEREQPVSRAPARKIALFTCMDTRLVDFLEPALGLRRGDAKLIKNAGNTIVDPTGGVIRSLVVAVHALGCEAILVVGHRDCGMAEIDVEDLQARMIARGVPAEAISALRPGLAEWLGAFRDPDENVRRVVGQIRQNPLIPDDVPVHGLMFDPASGRLDVLDRDDA